MRPLKVNKSNWRTRDRDRSTQRLLLHIQRAEELSHEGKADCKLRGKTTFKQAEGRRERGMDREREGERQSRGEKDGERWRDREGRQREREREREKERKRERKRESVS